MSCWDCGPFSYKKCKDIERVQTCVDIWRINFRGLLGASWDDAEIMHFKDNVVIVGKKRIRYI